MNLLKSPHYHKIQENSKKRFLKRKKTQKSESSVEIELEAKENLAQIGVYFQSLNTKLTYEKPKYEVRNLRARVICTSLYYDWIPQKDLQICCLFIIFQLASTIMSALGGSLSLYLGISVSMMFEVLEFLVDILISLFSFCATSRNQVVDSYA